jgi:hypothetical protein
MTTSYVLFTAHLALHEMTCFGKRLAVFLTQKKPGIHCQYYKKVRIDKFGVSAMSTTQKRCVCKRGSRGITVAKV